MGIHKHGSFTFKADHIYIYKFFVLCYTELPPPRRNLNLDAATKRVCREDDRLLRLAVSMVR